MAVDAIRDTNLLAGSTRNSQNLEEGEYVDLDLLGLKSPNLQRLSPCGGRGGIRHRIGTDPSWRRHNQFDLENI